MITFSKLKRLLDMKTEGMMVMFISLDEQKLPKLIKKLVCKRIIELVLSELPARNDENHIELN